MDTAIISIEEKEKNVNFLTEDKQSMQNLQYEYLDNRYENLIILGNQDKKTTYLANDTLDGRIVLKKYIQKEQADIYRRLLEVEEQHLVRIFYVAENEQQALVIMDYVSGQTVEQLQKAGRNFSEQEVITDTIQLLQGILTIHAQGIIHRDISPKNVLISTDGVVKLLDFDIGRKYKKSQGSDTTILGTVGYAAPEQFGFTQSDTRTDIYAIGVFMNMMLTGRLLWEVLYDKGRLGKIISKCTQIDPKKRYQNVEELLKELKRLSKEHQKEENWQKEQSIMPGFRTGVKWKKTLAGIYYVVMGVYSTAAIILFCRTVSAAILQGLALLIYGWLSILLPFNFLHWMDHVPFLKELGSAGRLIFGAVLFGVLFFAGAAFQGYLNDTVLYSVRL